MAIYFILRCSKREGFLSLPSMDEFLSTVSNINLTLKNCQYLLLIFIFMSNLYPNQYGQPIKPAYYSNSPRLNPFNSNYPPPPGIYEPSPTIIYVDNSSNQLPCPFCGSKTQTVMMKTPGGVTYMWCCCIFLTTGLFCWIPFCVNRCLDTKLMCVRCNNPKQIIPANCC